MFLEKAIMIAKVARLLDLMPSGGGWATPLQLAYFTGLSASTIYRYMPKLDKQGYFLVEEYTCRKIVCRRYRITELGKELALSQKEMF